MTRPLVLDAFLPYRLSVAANAVSTRISNAYRKQFGLKVAEWRLIAILAETGNQTPLMLGERTRMDKISVSRAAAALIGRGFLIAENNPQDGRSHLLSLTETGVILYDEIAPLALATEAQLFSELTRKERGTLEKLLRKVETAAY
jgi:DNA-binding MarR family transcriptional regulator